jgi:pre-rRNA-processing protein IPI3
LLGDIPRAVEMDAADRAFYTAYDDGSVQILDFYGTSDDVRASGPLEAGNDTPIQPPSHSRWHLPPQSDGDKQQPNHEAALCLSLSFDASRLLSGHASGKIRSWNVGRGQFHADLCSLPGSVTNLSCLMPTGFQQKRTPRFEISTVIKPRVDLGNDFDEDKEKSYYLRAEFPSDLALLSPKAEHDPLVEFEEALNHTSFPDQMLWEGIEELESWNPSKSSNKNGSASASADDFISLEEDNKPREMDLEEQNKLLQDQLQSLQRTQKESFKLLAKLRKDNSSLIRELEDKNRRQ